MDNSLNHALYAELTRKQRIQVAKIVFNINHWDVTTQTITEAIRCVEENIPYTNTKEPLISLLVDSINEPDLSSILSYMEHCTMVLRTTKGELSKKANWFLPSDIDEWMPHSPDGAVEDGIIEVQDLHERCKTVYAYHNKGTNKPDIIQRLDNGQFWTMYGSNAMNGSFEDCVDFRSPNLLW